MIGGGMQPPLYDMGTLATKNDLALLKAQIEAKLSATKAEFYKVIGVQTLVIIGAVHWMK